jgi:hypothetical protein
MIRRSVFAVLALCAAFPAYANDFSAVREKTAFLSLVEGRDLKIGIYNLSLSVLPDGKIKGRALGWDITGSWDWRDGYFCREMDWSGMKIPFFGCRP